MKDIYVEEDLKIVCDKISDLKELENSTVLVTGATGLIGSQTVKALIMLNQLKGANVKILAMIRNEEKAKKTFEEFLCDDLKFVKADINEKIDLDEEVDFIIHTASVTTSKFFVEHPVETLMTAINGTKNLLDLAVEKKSKGVVYLSSMEAFGSPDPKLDKVREDDLGYIDIHKVRSSYSEGKRVCELMCSCYAAEYGVPVKIARLAQTFGAGISYEENRVFAQFAKSAINKTDIVLHTKGLSVGNYCYTRDAVAAILLLLVKGNAGEAYTVANEESNITIGNMAKMVAEKIADNQIKVVFDIPESDLTYGYAPDVQMRLCSEKLQQLGWKPEVGLEESYKRMIASMLATKND